MPSTVQPSYAELVSRRRALRIEPYATLEDVGCDVPWITPFQISSRSEQGPALVALHWLDRRSIEDNRSVLLDRGYLPGMRFNKVLDLALEQRGLTRHRIYVTQVFHLVPDGRSEQIRQNALDKSFDHITRHELTGRKVVALGAIPVGLCKRHGISHKSACHPSRRANSNLKNAQDIAQAIHRLGY